MPFVSFDILVFDGEIVIPKGFKILPLEQRKKKKVFCKFHNFLGHKTCQCMLFRDLVQNTLKDEILKYTDKQKPRLEKEYDPKVDKALLFDLVDMLMVDITNDTKEVEASYEE